MDTAEWLTRGTVWLALTLYGAGEWAAAFAPGATKIKGACWLNGLGLVLFLGHVGCAFYCYHHWSHAAAYADTARQTAAFSGLDWGVGLYLNYLFTAVWTTESLWRGLSPATYAESARWMGWMVRGFFLFMICNGAVVFAHSPTRWYGLMLCILLAVCWWRLWKQPGTTQSI